MASRHWCSLLNGKEDVVSPSASLHPVSLSVARRFCRPAIRSSCRGVIGKVVDVLEYLGNSSFTLFILGSGRGGVEVRISGAW